MCAHKHWTLCVYVHGNLNRVRSNDFDDFFPSQMRIYRIRQLKKNEIETYSEFISKSVERIRNGDSSCHGYKTKNSSLRFT